MTIDVASISTGVAKLDEHLKSEDFFNVAKYPTITFKSKKLNSLAISQPRRWRNDLATT